MTTVLLRISDPQHDSSDFDDGFFLVVVVFFRLGGREKEFSFFIFFAFDFSCLLFGLCLVSFFCG